MASLIRVETENYEIEEPLIPPICPRCGYRHSTMHEVAYPEGTDLDDEYPHDQYPDPDDRLYSNQEDG